MKPIFLLSVLVLLYACQGQAQKKATENQNNFKINKTKAEWKAALTEQQYHVMIEQGTEPAFSSSLNKVYTPGTYYCAACNTPLFTSATKFDSGSGWPSFYDYIKGNVAFSETAKSSIYGSEEHCAICGAHLGHVFNDGPEDKTGKRHCINGVALKFVPKTK